MKHILVIMLLIFSIFLAGCLRNNNNAKINQSSTKNNYEVGDQSLAIENNSEEKAVRDMIKIHDNSIEVLFLAKVNFGVPDCENWLVSFIESGLEGISLFLIKDNRIIKEYFLGINDNFRERISYDIMKDIPGTRIGGGASAYGDYNSDSFVELFQYGFGGNGWFVNIKGYDAEADKIVNYCDEPGIPFGIVDPVNGPAPVEFMTYYGRYGFKVYIEANDVGGGADYIPEPMPYNRRWFFYAWDEAEKMYVEIGEVD